MNKSIAFKSFVLFVLMFTSIYSQKLSINNSAVELQNPEYTIIKFDLGQELKIGGIFPSASSYKFKILPLNHGKSDGFIVINCSDKKRNLGKTIRTKKTRQIQTQSQEEIHNVRLTNNGCNSDFTLVTKETDCFNRIFIQLIARVNGKSRVYRIELRPNQRCD